MSYHIKALKGIIRRLDERFEKLFNLARPYEGPLGAPKGPGAFSHCCQLQF